MRRSRLSELIAVATHEPLAPTRCSAPQFDTTNATSVIHPIPGGHSGRAHDHRSCPTIAVNSQVGAAGPEHRAIRSPFDDAGWGASLDGRGV